MDNLQHAPATVNAGSHNVYGAFGNPQSLYFVLQRINQSQIAHNLMHKAQTWRKSDISIYSVGNELPFIPNTNLAIYPASSINTHLTGTLIATCPETLKLVHEAVTPATKAFYMYDVAWMNFAENNWLIDLVSDIIPHMHCVMFRSYEHAQFATSKLKCTGFVYTSVGDFNLSIMHDFIYRGKNG
jgi:hypothetical protein